MRVGVIQVPSVSEDVLELIQPPIESAVAQGAQLVVLPEGVMHDFRPEIDLAVISEPLDGRFVSGLGALASRLSVTIVAGMWERLAGENRPANTLVVVGPTGQLMASYRKIHLFDSFGFRESDRVVPGVLEPVTFEAGELTVGLATCYDLRFPEIFRAMAGADMLALPAGWIAGPLKLHHWETLLTARAIENTAYVAAAGICGHGYTGHSMVIDPMGEPLVMLDDEPAVGVVEIQRSRVDEVRRINPSLEHRRL